MTNGAIQLRKATAADIEQLLPLVAAYHEFEQLDSTEQQRLSALNMLLSDKALGGIWLVYSDEQLAGYIALCRGFSIEFGGFDAFVDEFFLKERFRGEGLGTQVLHAIKAEARDLAIQALHLEVARSNEPAKKLYSKVGFEARDKYVLMSVYLDT